jgi:hypothetical protein
MKRAWQIYKLGGVPKEMLIPNIAGEMHMLSYREKNFSECLKRAWEIEKENAAEAGKKMEPIVFSQEAYDSFYSGVRYFGD